MFKTRVFGSVGKNLGYLVAGLTALACTSCVKLVTSEQAAIEPSYRGLSPVGLSVVDRRENVSGGFRKKRYLGRCRLGLYGIPTPILDPKVSLEERVRQQLQAGFANKGIEIVAGNQDPQGAAAQVATGFPGARRTLVVRINDDTWIDFANPIMGNESILYFSATAEVLSPAGKVHGRADHKITREFRYDANDSLFNQALWTLRPEFTKLIDQPEIRAALSR